MKQNEIYNVSSSNLEFSRDENPRTAQDCHPGIKQFRQSNFDWNYVSTRAKANDIQSRQSFVTMNLGYHIHVVYLGVVLSPHSLKKLLFLTVDTGARTHYLTKYHLQSIAVIYLKLLRNELRRYCKGPNLRSF